MFWNQYGRRHRRLLYELQQLRHGFLFSSGTYTTIDHPGELATFLSGINDEGAIVGYAYPAAYAFVYNPHSQTFTNIFNGGWFIYPHAINNAGTIAGFLSFFGPYGFELAASGESKEIVVPGGFSTYASGISASGEVVGYYVSSQGQLLSFSFNEGIYRTLQIPNAPLAKVSGINPAGTALVGSYAPSSGVTAGFIYQNQTLTTLQFPGSDNTAATSVNANGQVVGTFYDASGKYHGFLWTPPANMAKR